MSGFGTDRILAHVGASDFVGRASELDRLLSLANADAGGIALLATPGAGASELLRQVYDRQFHSSGAIPFYFEFRLADLTAQAAAERFALDFLTQAMAFRRRNASLLGTSPDLRTLSILGAQQDTLWLDHEISMLEEDGAVQGAASIERLLAAPIRALASGVRSLVIVDALHIATQLADGEVLIDWFARLAERVPLPVILGGARRHLYGLTSLPVMDLDVLSFEDAGTLVEQASERNAVEINEQVRDLIAVQLRSSPAAITSFVESVRGTSLTSFESVEKAYTDAIFGGRLSRRLTRIMAPAFPSQEAETAFIRLFDQMAQRRIHDFRVSADPRSAIDTIDLGWLHINEIVNLSSGSFTIDHSDDLLLDVMNGRHRLEVERAPRALVVGEAVSANVKRSTDLMATFYQRRSAIDLRTLMESFNGRQVPAAVLDYGMFKTEFKGADDADTLRALREETNIITLPRIVYTARTETFGTATIQAVGEQNSAVGLGFDPEKKAEVAWLAAQIESKLEAKRTLAEYWCDRLDDIARPPGFSTYRLWLISPEGFTDDALALLAERGAFGTSRKQIELLNTLLQGESSSPYAENSQEYEFIVPMGDDTEIIAARAVEDIAKRHGIPQKAINQIKTAVVEACINAVEHGKSPDRKIYQKFVVEPGRITITIANRGLRLADREAKPDEGRRGWGLKLIQGLMDEVRIDDTDDGTQVTMTKFISEDAELRLVSS